MDLYAFHEKMKDGKIINSNVNFNTLKRFVSVPFFIPWYHSKESNKVFPLMIQEIGDLNPIKLNKLGESIIGHNPFFEHTDIFYFVIEDSKGPIGRVAAFIDHNYNKENDVKAGWIGMFECIENDEVKKYLLDSAVGYLKRGRCKEVIGPGKFNANGEIGLLIDGFEHKPYFMEPYNPPYYQDIFEGFGFEKANDWYSVVGSSESFKEYADKIDRLNEKLKNNRRGKELDSINFRTVDFKNMDEEIKKIRKVYNEEWGHGNHPQFVKMTSDEFQKLAEGIKDVALEDLIFIAEKNEKPIGVAVSVPNINEVIEDYDSRPGRESYRPSERFLNLKDINRDLSIYIDIKKRLKKKDFRTARILILGVRDEYTKKGIDGMLYSKTANAMLDMGIKEASGSALADVNMSIVNPLTKMGDIAFTWRVYRLKL